jgi:hypothetical protein
MEFFTTYDRFTKTGSGAQPERLNRRYIALMENNNHIIQNSTILDIASHDGRWSFAAIKNGAKQVIGIEGRQELVDSAIENMMHYDIEPNRYHFITGDIHQEIHNIKERIDVVLLLGFFYHTMKHYELFEAIKKISPKYIILDSNVFNTGPDTPPLIYIKKEPTSNPLYAIGEKEFALVGVPNKAAINIMLDDIGYTFQYFDWQKISMGMGISHCQDYKDGNRITLTASLKE